MPLDKDQLKRVSNLLNTLQVRTALESTNASPKRMDTYNLQRLIDVNIRDKAISKYHAEQLEKQGEQIDPVTKKPFNRSEKWLQSTGQQIPGLDSDGVSAMNALDLIGLPGAVKIAGTIGREGVKRGIGRVATNIVSTGAENISSSLQGHSLRDMLKAIKDDVPIYDVGVDEVPYRKMFGLKPREFKQLTEEGEEEIFKPIEMFKNNPDGSIRFVEGSESYRRVKGNMLNGNIRNGSELPQEYVMGHYNQTGNRYWDKWDVGLNPGELKRNLKAIQNIKTPEDIYNLHGLSTNHYNSVPTFKPDKVINSVGEIDKTKLALEKTKSILRLLERAAVRKTVDMFTDPVVIQGTIKGIR